MSGLPTIPDASKIPPNLRAEIEKRNALKGLAKGFKGFLGELHPHQKKFILDKSRRKAALCSRRAGKSFLILAWLIEGGLTDFGGRSVYVARSKGGARGILEPAIFHFQQKWPDLGLAFKEIDGQLMLEIGCSKHTIWLAGAKDQSEVAKFRGQKYKRVAIDEAQEYGFFLRQMVIDIFEPALLDKKGDLGLFGTPHPIPSGLFYEATTGDGGPKWATHHWTLFDNPHIQDAEAEVQGFIDQYGLNRDSATFRREYLGQWVRDEGMLVYPYSYTLNAIRAEDVPEGLSYVLGIDVGFTDASAFVISAVARGKTPHIYILEAFKKTGMIPETMAARVNAYIAQYGRGLRIVVDEGGAGKGYAETMRQRYAIGCEAAEKTKKRAYQEIVAGELKSGTIKIVASECRDLLDEISILQWGPGRIAQSDKFEDHVSDSFLYSVRASHAWYKAPKLALEAGTPEYDAAERLKTRAMILERVKKRNKGKSWRNALNK